ncbi:MAG: helix-turn-helix transcriptional regulator [Thermoprotei archaeon]|nr:helix-turn-helix transcriptional regulator [Thermoprotei archaeon]
MNIKVGDLINGNKKVLLALLDQGELTISELKERCGLSLTGMYSALNKLIKAGLLEEVRESNFPFRRLVRLTKKGREAALLLRRLDEILKM